jgi:carbon storage regulator
MLVLSRKVGEKIVIDGGVVLVVKRIAGQRVTLGIEAPNNVHIVRGELAPFAKNEPPGANAGETMDPWRTPTAPGNAR